MSIDWQLASSLAANVIALGALLWRWLDDRAPSVTIRETEYSPYPRFQVEVEQQPQIENQYFLELELSNTSRKHPLEKYDFMIDCGQNATIELAEAISRSSLRPVEVLEETAISRRYRINNFDPGDVVIFRIRLSNVSANQCSVDGYARGVRLRRVQLKNGMVLK